MKVFSNIWNRIVLIFFCGYILCMAVLSLKWVAEMDFANYAEVTTLVERSPVRSIVMTLLLVAIFCILGILIKRSKNIAFTANTIIITSIVVHVALAILWVAVNDYPTDADQRIVWKTAEALFRGQDLGELDNLMYDPFQANVVEYFSHYPYQAGMLYAMKFVMGITGVTDPLAWRILNIIALALFEVGLVVLSGEVFKNDRYFIMAMTAILQFLFLPPVLYTTFVYGTILSMTMIIWVLYGTVKLLKSENALYAILPIILIPLANRVYGGTLIATIAVVITLVVGCLEEKKKKRVILIFTAALIIAGCVLTEKLSRHALNQDMGIPVDIGGIPVSDTIYMGIAVEDGVVGPGSHAGIVTEMYKEYGEETSSYALGEDIKVVKEYLNGERNPTFFVEKTKYQWLDPYFEGLTMTCYPWSGYEANESFLTFLHGPIPQMLYKNWLRYFLPFIYALSLVAGIGLLIKKDNNLIRTILSLYFVGGFTFQIIWESKSRYCLPYFMCLIPMAAYGLVIMIKRFSKEKDGII